MSSLDIEDAVRMAEYEFKINNKPKIDKLEAEVLRLKEIIKVANTMLNRRGYSALELMQTLQEGLKEN